jgi:hypothetical protein
LLYAINHNLVLVLGQIQLGLHKVDQIMAELHKVVDHTQAQLMEEEYKEVGHMLEL